MTETGLRFIAALYDHHDACKRHQRFYWNAALTGLGYRKFARNPQERQSYSMSMSGDDGPIPAFQESRLITRADLTQPSRNGRIADPNLDRAAPSQIHSVRHEPWGKYTAGKL